MAKRTRITSKARSSFLVEALLLLACVIILLAVTLTLFMFANDASAKAQRLQEASDLAQNTAERFAADPEAVPEAEDVGDYTVLCDVEAQNMDAGVMYRANVVVVDDLEEVCSLSTSKYVSGKLAEFEPISYNPEVEDSAEVIETTEAGETIETVETTEATS